MYKNYGTLKGRLYRVAVFVTDLVNGSAAV